MTAPETNFDGVAEGFGLYGEQVRGRIRYDLVRLNLQPYLEGPSLDIVDVGGGAAIDASYMASLGHRVTVVEPSAEQISKAERRLAHLSPETRSNITVIHGLAEDLLSNGEAGRYDMALSHGVAMYIDEWEGFIANLAKLVRKGGRASLLEKGFYGQEARLIRQGNIQELTRLYKEKKVTNNMGRSVHAFLPEDLENAMKEAGIHVLEWTGVRLITDHDTRLVESLDPAEYEAIVKAEYTQGRNDGIRAQGQMLHFIGAVEGV